MAWTRFTLGAALAATALPAAAQTAAPTVTLTQGKVAGKYNGPVSAFLGIPYGADTGGANRFRAPRPAPGWTGVRQATEFGNLCPQPKINKPGALITFAELPVSEDCLSLNVWTTTTKAAKRPVMVWLHGGGFGFGSSADKYYEGSSLAANQNVILVSINHRLNGFGYLNLGPEAGGAFDANVGQLDIVEALRWVRKNIAKFGGDPANVTVFGQSGGGGKISSMLAMPVAKGLFQKAIIMSGSDPRNDTIEQSIAVRDKVLAAAGLTPGEVLKLRDIPMQQLIDIFTKVGALAYHPWVDGTVETSHPFDPAANPAGAKVPVLVGYTHDEANSVLVTNPIWPSITDANLPTVVALATGPDHAAEGIALYRKRMPNEEPRYIFSAMMTDQSFTTTAMTLAERKLAQSAPVYMYRYDWHTPVRDGILRAPHGFELPFLFGTQEVSRDMIGSGPAQDRMQLMMQSTFAAFARTGNPNFKGSPYPFWPRYDMKSQQVFIFNDPPAVARVSEPELVAFWAKVARDKKK
ncbi:MAG: carboxylesterase/lipase family protein [Sphingomonas sp.]